MEMVIRKMIFALLLLAACVALGACAYLHQPKFGRLPDGDRLAALTNSPHYVDGEFRNLIETPMFTEDRGFFSGLTANLFAEKKRRRPVAAIPSVKTDLRALNREVDAVVWLGHSSYFLQLGGRRILIDPVFSDHAAPLPFLNKAFAGTTLYTADDMPDIDYLLISHDHWDHLDYPTVTALQKRIGKVICGLGVGAHLAHWGYPETQIVEADWFETLRLEEDLIIHVLPARHFSGRLLARNKTLWIAFALETSQRRVFFSGDSGYGPHFAEIGEMFDGFDLAILENGQYDPLWAYIHMLPEETARAAEELHARALLPGHAGKFCISNHAWDDPFIRLTEASREKPYRLLTPKIGEVVDLSDGGQRFSHWWEGIE